MALVDQLVGRADDRMPFDLRLQPPIRHSIADAPTTNRNQISAANFRSTNRRGGDGGRSDCNEQRCDGRVYIGLTCDAERYSTLLGPMSRSPFDTRTASSVTISLGAKPRAK